MGLATAIQQLRAVLRESGSNSRILTPADVEALREVLAAHAPPAKAEDQALVALVEAAREFGRKTPRRHPSGAYGRSLRQLVEAAQHASAMGDLAWAAEVAELRDQVDHLAELLGAKPGDDPEKLKAEVSTALDRHRAGTWPAADLEKERADT